MGGALNTLPPPIRQLTFFCQYIANYHWKKLPFSRERRTHHSWVEAVHRQHHFWEKNCPKETKKCRVFSILNIYKQFDTVSTSFLCYWYWVTDSQNETQGAKRVYDKKIEKILPTSLTFFFGQLVGANYHSPLISISNAWLSKYPLSVLARKRDILLSQKPATIWRSCKKCKFLHSKYEPDFLKCSWISSDRQTH